MRFFSTYLLSFVLLATTSCINKNSKVKNTPFGQWESNYGHDLYIYTDGVYKICLNKSCSLGNLIIFKDSRISVVLQNFLNKEQIALQKSDLFECVNAGNDIIGDKITFDIDFFPLKNRRYAINSGKSTVEYQCGGVTIIEFNKKSDFIDKISESQIDMLNRNIKKGIPCPEMR
jgi:hypothetical protein